MGEGGGRLEEEGAGGGGRGVGRLGLAGPPPAAERLEELRLEGIDDSASS